MASKTDKPHFLLIPFMSPGHIIPMIDIARLLAEQNVKVTVVVTPHNLARFRSTVDRAAESGLSLHFLQLQFPSDEAGLPPQCENADTIVSRDMFASFFNAVNMLQEPLEQALRDMEHKPSCLVSDKAVPFTAATASKFNLPRILFDGMSCFSILCSHNLLRSKIYEKVSDSDPFLVPGLPDRIELKRSQLPGIFNPGSNPSLTDFRKKVMNSAGVGVYGVIVNSFEELEKEYVKAYREATGHKVWCIGPVSLCNKERSEKAERGKRASIDVEECLKWLDKWAEKSVIYVCFGSINQLSPQHLIELGMALEASKRPFIWVIREAYKKEAFEHWLLETKFEQRVKQRGLLVRGWAPQVLILSNPSIGAFLTHCGWNSTLEGICAGVPMITWPMFGEQFYNEKMVVQVLRVGVRVGVEEVVHLGEEERFGVLVRREDVEKAIERVMDEGEEGQERRRRVSNLAAEAAKAVAEGGSSMRNIALLVQDIRRQV